MLLDGRLVAQQILSGIKSTLQQPHPPRRPPCLVAILATDNPASQTYVTYKAKACSDVGIASRVLRIAPEALLDTIRDCNHDPSVDGILVQLPLPVDPLPIMAAVDPSKDVDGFHPVNVGKLLLHDPSGFVPCTPLGIQALLTHYAIDVAGKHVVIVGRSNIVGKPLAALLVQNAPGCNATVTIAHSKTRQLEALLQTADIIVAATGQPRMITASMVRQGSVVVDVGITRVDGKLVGDVDFEAVAPRCSAITPVPGGVGPMTIAMLLHNTLRSYQART